MLHFSSNILNIRTVTGLSQAEFAVALGTSQDVITNFENRPPKKPNKLVVAEIANLANLEMNQILEGEIRIEQLDVEKIKSSFINAKAERENNVTNKNYQEDRRNHKLNHIKEDDIGVYQAGTKGSFIDLYEDENTTETIGKLNSSIFPGCDLALKVTGSSMYPMIVNQSIIVGERLEDPKGISSGEIYAVHTKRGLKTCKYVHTLDSKPDYIKLVALSKSVPPQTIPVEDIILLMRVYFIINPS